MITSMILAILLAYLAGSIPTAIWVGKAFHGIDIRQHGSGNAGATNTIRVLGWKAGVPVLLVDIFKGWLAVWAGTQVIQGHLDSGELVYFRIGLAAVAVAGHVFPAFAGFRGGKGVATLLGVGFALYPHSAWVALVVFVLALLISGYVSVSSMAAAMTFPLVEIFLFRQQHIGLIILAVLVAVFIPFIHRKNIKRLIRGEETKFRPGKKKD